MADLSPRDILSRFIAGLNSRDFTVIDEYLHPDYVEEWPQSGERVRGRANLRAVFENYPEGERRPVEMDLEHSRIVGSEDRWVLSPSSTLLRVTGTGDNYTVYLKSRYPDGSYWFVIEIVTFRDGKIARAVNFYAPCFDPPDWRKQWVEIMEEPFR